jgi:hypothetical protein
MGITIRNTGQGGTIRFTSLGLGGTFTSTNITSGSGGGGEGGGGGGGGGGTPLLDTYTDAAAAFSLRKLRAAYSGNAIRVRRSNDNAEQDIGFINNQLDTGSLATFTANNIFIYSEDFSNWQTNLSATVNSNVTTDPLGGSTADRVNFGSSANSEIYIQPVTWQTATYTLSIYAKSDTKSKFRLKIWNGSTAYFSPDITATSTWTRYSYTVSVAGGVGNFGISNEAAGGAGAIFMWGAQGNLGQLQPYTQVLGTPLVRSGFVTVWYDQTGNNINLVQTTANSQPRISNSGQLEIVNNKPAIYFDGTDDSMTGTMNLTFNVALFEVFKINETNGFVINTLNGNYNLAGLNGGSNPPNGALTIQNTYKNSISTPSTSQTQVNSTYNTNTPILSSQLQIASGDNLTSFGISNFSGWSLTGHFQEIVLYASNQTSSRSGIESNINSYYLIY